MNGRQRLFWILLVIFALEWVVLAFGVHERSTWYLENILLAVFFGPFVWLYLKGYISKLSFVLLFVFVAAHTLGAHFTYSLVPYDDWSQNIFGSTFNSLFGWKRNHYDRLIHFLFGFLFFQPLREMFFSRFKVQGRVLVPLVILSITSASTAYELMEWIASLLASEEAGHAFLGSQGDIWDAHKDMALAIGGSILASFVFVKFKPKARFT